MRNFIYQSYLVGRAILHTRMHASCRIHCAPSATFFISVKRGVLVRLDSQLSTPKSTAVPSIGLKHGAASDLGSLVIQQWHAVLAMFVMSKSPKLPHFEMLFHSLPPNPSTLCSASKSAVPFEFFLLPQSRCVTLANEWFSRVHFSFICV